MGGGRRGGEKGEERGREERGGGEGGGERQRGKERGVRTCVEMSTRMMIIKYICSINNRLRELHCSIFTEQM